MRKKISKIWTTPKEDLVKIVNQSKTLAEIIRALGFAVFTAANYRSIQSRMKQDGIDYSHIPIGIGSNKNRPTAELTKEEALEKWFKVVEFAGANNSRVKFIKKFNLIRYECQKCKNNGNWQGEKLTLQLDHINGVREDNRLKNLRFLCPNCHSQTVTFSGKNK